MLRVIPPVDAAPGDRAADESSSSEGAGSSAAGPDEAAVRAAVEPTASGAVRVTAAAPLPGPADCPACGQPVDPLRARHLAVVEGRVVPFCSDPCRVSGPRPRHPILEEVAPVAARHALRWLLAAAPIAIALGLLLGARISIYWRTANAQSEAAVAAAASSSHHATPPPARPAPPAPPPPIDTGPDYGPAQPPAFVETDRWLHPLPGPERRLPERPTRRFGAGRDHDSPDSCGGGHCGVDIGMIAGEPVLAVHDGTVERVVRTEGADRGGRYVRLLHLDGKVVTQYMHLGRVADNLGPGTHVRAGDVLGTVGDTGTHNSGPHLHFTFATRAAENAPEFYIDPLGLLTVWPLSGLEPRPSK